MLHATRRVAWLLLPFFCLFLNNSFAVNEAAVFSYIEMYKDIAIQERIRTGIPASITLAQGLYESGIGASELATEANNHFGIKCKSTWQGESHYVEDDDYDANGKLMKSCFRKYGSAEESYRDHSDFLVNNSRYSELFMYAATDYKAWAKGLKRCGYATNPEYADKLIELINRYDLYLYDQIQPNYEEVLVESPVQTTPELHHHSKYNPEIEILPNDPNAPAAYSVADYVRNSYTYATQEVKTNIKVEATVEQIQYNSSQDSWEETPIQHTNLAQNSISDSPVPAQEEVLSAPMYDIEYYELTEKGLPNRASQNKSVKPASSQVSSLRIYPRKQQFKRRGK